MREAEEREGSTGIKSFMQKQREILGGLITDQLGPSAQLDEIISGNPPLENEEGMKTEPEFRIDKNK